ncbi:Aldo keto reductase [Boletus edulis]|nr:Aldo keto reductase [Boletus edulis]
MPWDPIRMNSGKYYSPDSVSHPTRSLFGYAGHSIPSIAFGTWSLGNGQNPIDQLTHVLQNGFNHIDTAQAYGNETEVGTALRESGRSRTDVFITTKYSGTNGLDIDMSIRNSIVNLGVDYVDLYLIHERHLAVPDIPTAWAKMESIKEAGLARSIGVSNFNEEDLEILLASAEIKPVVNHLLLHPYVYHRQRPVMEYAAKHGIVIGAYMTLTPITHQPGGPLDAPLNAIASRLGATTDQVLFQWTKAKGAVVITTSSKKSRLPGYLTAGDIELTQQDIGAIDAAGAMGKEVSTQN